MKKILPILIIVILVLNGLGVVAQNNIKENTNTNNNTNKSERVTHTVFGEYGTATWCGYCKYAHEALKELYAEGQLDFNYVSLVTDKNTKAYQRCVTDYNDYGWPTLWWDGGYKVDVGAGSVAGAKATYTDSINTCGNRAVKDVDLNLTVNWLGGTEMQIDASVTNNEGSTYGGTIRVYITEKESSMGWIDSGGQKYTHAFLDWAFNQAISIPAGNTWSDSMTWDGASNGFPSVTSDNIMIIAAVFNDEWHQGYSYPPSGNPFDAYYVDKVVTAEPMAENNPPNMPSNPSPSNGATNIDLNADLSWTCSDPDNDTLTYDVYFGTVNPPQKIISNQSGTSYNPGEMNNQTMYYWKIVAWDPYDAFNSSPIWYFTTTANNPPSTPSNPNPSNGATNVDVNAQLSWTCNDPNGDSLVYDVYFGTSSNPPLVSSGQSQTYYDPPGAMNYNTQYFWKIVAEDEYGATTTGPVWSFTTGSGSQTNNPPYIPSNPTPENGSTNIEQNVILNWTGGDPDPSDTVVYNVYLEANNPNPSIMVSDNQNETSFNTGPLNLEPGTIYYWKIYAIDNHYAVSIGTIWHFTTKQGPTNNPPDTPTIDGPANGKIKWLYTYTFTAVDPEGDDIYYWVEHQNSSVPEQGWEGPYPSGTPIIKTYSWSKTGTFTVKCKAKDIYGLESNWATLNVVIPRNQIAPNMLLQRFLQNHPTLFTILQKLLNRLEL